MDDITATIRCENAQNSTQIDDIEERIQGISYTSGTTDIDGNLNVSGTLTFNPQPITITEEPSFELVQSTWLNSGNLETPMIVANHASITSLEVVSITGAAVLGISGATGTTGPTGHAGIGIMGPTGRTGPTGLGPTGPTGLSATTKIFVSMGGLMNTGNDNYILPTLQSVSATLIPTSNSYWMGFIAPSNGNITSLLVRINGAATVGANNIGITCTVYKKSYNASTTLGTATIATVIIGDANTTQTGSWYGSAAVSAFDSLLVRVTYTGTAAMTVSAQICFES